MVAFGKSLELFIVSDIPLAFVPKRMNCGSWPGAALSNFLTLYRAAGTRVSKGRDVPGQTGTGRPVVPLSWDIKKILVPVSLCPGPRAGANVHVLF